MREYWENTDVTEYAREPADQIQNSDWKEVQDIPADLSEDEAFAQVQDIQKEVQDIPADMELDYDEMAAAVPTSEMQDIPADVDVPGEELSKAESMDVPGEELSKAESTDVPGEELGKAESMDIPGEELGKEDDTEIPGEHYETSEEQDEGSDTKDISEIMEDFKGENWEGLSDDAKKEALGELADYAAQDLGIKDKPKIVFYNEENPGDFGGYSESENTIYINEYNMDNATETADTITHETRHCYQHERAEHPQTEEDYAFRDNFENYVTPDLDFEAYEDQIVEADARAYAQGYRDMLD